MMSQEEVTSKLKLLLNSKPIVQEYKINFDYDNDETREVVKLVLWTTSLLVPTIENELTLLFRAIRSCVPKQWQVKIVIRSEL